jgi:hypothetical protein
MRLLNRNSPSLLSAYGSGSMPPGNKTMSHLPKIRYDIPAMIADHIAAKDQPFPPISFKRQTNIRKVVTIYPKSFRPATKKHKLPRTKYTFLSLGFSAGRAAFFALELNNTTENITRSIPSSKGKSPGPGSLKSPNFMVRACRITNTPKAVKTIEELSPRAA